MLRGMRRLTGPQADVTAPQRSSIMGTAGPGPCHVIAGMDTPSCGRRLTGTVTKSNLGLRAPARVPAAMCGHGFGAGQDAGRPDLGVLRADGRHRTAAENPA